MSVFTNANAANAEDTRAYVESVVGLLADRDPFVVLDELPDAINELLEDVTDDELREPEAPGKWSIIDVLQHLADTEIVYGQRFRMIVAHDDPEITGFDQDLWATRLRYREVPLETTLKQLLGLRAANLWLLRSLSPEDYGRAGNHTERGRESIRHMLDLFAGHDLVHRRQIERIKQAKR